MRWPKTRLGRITLEKKRLQAIGAKVLLFTHEGFFTGAIRIDTWPDFCGFDELHIALAPFYLY